MAENDIVTPLGPIRNAEDFMGFIEQINGNPDLLATLPQEDAQMYRTYNEMQAEYNQLRAALYLPLEVDQETRETAISLILTARRRYIIGEEVVEQVEEDHQEQEEPEEEEEAMEPGLGAQEDENGGNEEANVVQAVQEPRQGQQG
ncbi:hypothetical protein CAEBREN_17430 [Caenorhabditis brenneri]|uniref:Uncharacterized protein n=1 Tax=Caenorhabditis brenneri TaxID=135651 RepID=G0P6H0_CAEBE|nr:hypothetical protein CAEBREN_17430 [Caenorhabditis brenneri]